jgi:hypothetical protein
MTPTPTPIATPLGGRPLLFSQFSGNITVGGQPAINGTFIEARVEWWRSRPSKVFNGSYSPIIIAPNDWALDGKTISFHYGELQAAETSIYRGSAFQVLVVNLTFP